VMMKRLLMFTILVLYLPFSAVASDVSDFYYGYSEFANTSLFTDPNTGRTLFPTLLVPMGGMYEGLGTAYTAVAQGSGFLEANPAGSSQLKYTELSFHHNNWIADSSIEGVVYSIRKNNFGMGVGGKFLYLPFTEFNSWGERDSRGYVSETVATFNASYNFFSSYYFHGISLGTNVKFAYRHIPASIYPGQSIITGLADFGFLTRFNLFKFYSSRERNFSVGGVIKNLGMPYENEPMPTLATGGIAYSPFRPVLFSFDFNYPIAFGLPPEEWEKWYLAGGFKVQFTNFFSMHSGFTHRGANPRFTLGSNINLDYIDLILNYTLDMTTQVNTVDRFSVEAKMNLGDRGRAELRQQVDEYYIEGLEAYAQGELERAIDYWEAALTLDPTFQPATENILVARKALSLQQDMESLNIVE